MRTKVCKISNKKSQKQHNYYYFVIAACCSCCPLKKQKMRLCEKEAHPLGSGCSVTSVCPQQLAVSNWLFLVAEQDVVDAGDVNSGDLAVAIHVASGDVSLVAIEQVVVEAGDVNSGNLAVAVHVAIDATAKGGNNNLVRPVALLSAKHCLHVIEVGGGRVEVGNLVAVGSDAGEGNAVEVDRLGCASTVAINDVDAGDYHTLAIGHGLELNLLVVTRGAVEHYGVGSIGVAGQGHGLACVAARDLEVDIGVVVISLCLERHCHFVLSQGQGWRGQVASR